MIMDSYGLFEKLWQFSADLVKKGFKIIEIGNSEKFLDGNFKKVNEQMDKYILRADMKGMLKNTTYAVGGVCYKAIEVEGHIYIISYDGAKPMYLVDYIDGIELLKEKVITFKENPKELKCVLSNKNFLYVLAKFFIFF